MRLARENRADASAARSVVATQQGVIRDAVADRDAAAQSAIGQIEEITSADGLRDSWWDNWGSKVVGWIAKVAEFVASVAGILALVLCWVPGLGQILLGIAAVAGIVAAVANVALAATGEKSWVEAGISVAFAALGVVGLRATGGLIGTFKTGAKKFAEAGGLLGHGGLRGLLTGSIDKLTSGVKNVFARFRPPAAATNLADDAVEVAAPTLLAKNVTRDADGVVNIHLKFKAGWTDDQIAQAIAKAKAVNSNNPVVTTVTRGMRTPNARSMWQRAYGKISSGLKVDVDHILDLQLGGKNVLSNLQLLDRSVNRSLGAQISNAIRRDNLPEVHYCSSDTPLTNRRSHGSETVCRAG